MTERPILFSGEMIRAILAGRKTQTRRICKPVRGFEHNNILKYGMPHSADPCAVWWHSEETDHVGCMQECPYGVPGDRLWVREKHWVVERNGYGIGVPWLVYDEEWVGSHVDEDAPLRPWYWPTDRHKFGPRPSIFMPRWASRITLEITGVRVERLQSISADDVTAEGVRIPVSTKHAPDGKAFPLMPITGKFLPSDFSDKPWDQWPEDDYYRFWYARLWTEINGAESWRANPFVWVVEFRDISADVRAAA